MKKVFIIFLFYACQNPKPIDGNLFVDSSLLAANNKAKKLRSDSIISIEEKKAISDINFFISENEFEKKKIEFYKKFNPEKNLYGDYKIGDYKFFQAIGSFYKGLLYSIWLQGEVIKYDKYGTEMPHQYDAIMSILQDKYGQANSVDGVPHWNDLQKGDSKQCAYWIFGNKKIYIEVTCDGTYYQLNLTSFRTDVADKINEEEEKNSIRANQKAKGQI